MIAKDLTKSTAVVLGARWVAEPDACDLCAELDGSTDWTNDAPDGPPLHPNCRCELSFIALPTGKKTVDPVNSHWQGVLKSLRKNCGTGSGGFQPGNKCGGEGGGSDEGESSGAKKPGDTSEVAGARGPVKITHGPLEGKRFNDFDEDEPNAVAHANDVEIVKDKFGFNEKDDDYLYHVTTKDAAEEIKYSGITTGNKGTFSGYEAHSQNRAFLTERSGVAFWSGKIEDNLNATKDYDEDQSAEDDIAVVRVPKDKVRGTLQTDLEGTRDSSQPSYFVQPDNNEEGLVERNGV